MACARLGSEPDRLASSLSPRGATAVRTLRGFGFAVVVLGGHGSSVEGYFIPNAPTKRSKRDLFTGLVQPSQVLAASQM